jgi:hypothetical protein
MEAAALAAPDGWPLTWRPSASSRTATGLLLQMPRSSCIVLHGVDLKIQPAPRGTSFLNNIPEGHCKNCKKGFCGFCSWR